MFQNLHSFFLDHISVSRNFNIYLTCMFLFIITDYVFIIIIIIIIIIINLGHVIRNVGQRQKFTTTE
jgi:hypothetical protein